MRKYVYIVTFLTGEVEIVSAFTEDSAKILAQAKQIEKGNSYTVFTVSKEDKVEKHPQDDFKRVYAKLSKETTKPIKVEI